MKGSQHWYQIEGLEEIWNFYTTLMDLIRPPAAYHLFIVYAQTDEQIEDDMQAVIEKDDWKKKCGQLMVGFD